MSPDCDASLGVVNWLVLSQPRPLPAPEPKVCVATVSVKAPDWQKLEAALFHALRPFAEARRAVVEAIAEAFAGEACESG